MSAFHRKVVLRYLRSRQGFVSVVTSFSLAGITLGVAALIVVMAVMAGFRQELTTRILGMVGHATLTVDHLTAPYANLIKADLEKQPGVQSATPFIQGQAMIVSNGKASGALVHAEEGQPSFLTTKITQGRLADLSHPNTVAIGATLAHNLGVDVGDGITLLSPQGTQTIMGFIPRMQRFQVVALFDVGMYVYDNGWLAMSLPTAQAFYGLGDTVSAVDIRVDSPETIADQSAGLLEKVKDPSAHLTTWQDSNRDFFEALQVERVAMFMILCLIVVVAAFNIVTGQTMMVNDKTRSIAILRTMGARRKDILSVFFWNGVLIGTVGTVGGLLLGLIILTYLHPIVHGLESLFGVPIFSGEAYFLKELPAKIVVSDLLTVAGFSFAISLLAGLYPAWRAAKMDPVEILRNG